MEYFKNINESIKRYLETEITDYAILINGPWGSGKTYYFQNIIEDIIGTIENKDYKYIYISLYGVNNFEEITKNIMWQAATATNKLGNKAKFFGSKLATFVSDVGFGKLGMEGNPLKGFLDQSNDLNLEDIILCFDDLERSHISPNKVFGYINDFVEHQNMKTFIIGHEKKLEEIFIKENIENKWSIALNWIDINKENNGDKVSKKDVNKEIKDIFSEYNFYKQIKEKLIGKTIDFRPKDGYYETVVLDNIISNFEDDNYKEFILKNKTEIINIFKSNKYNIRSLKHALDDFYIIHEEVEGEIYSDFLSKIFYFALICTFENKNQQVEIEEIKKVTYADVYTSYLFESDEVSEEVQIFYTKYFDKGIEFEKINSIVDYIITGYLNIDLFHKEIDQLKIKKTKSNLELIEQFWKLDDDEFEESLELLTSELKNGEYEIAKYIKILKKYITLHSLDLLDLSLEEMEQIFIDGIEESLKNNEPENFIDAIVFQSERVDRKYDELYEKIVKILKEKNEEFKEKKYNEDIDEILEYKKEYEALRDFMQHMNNYVDFYLYVDSEKLTKYLKDKNNGELNKIINLLIDKIENLQIDKNDFAKCEEVKQKLVKLNEEINREFDFNNQRLSRALIKRLYKAINKKIELLA